ncbi:thioesterase family protein [Nocardia transvalensis]|uniref:thioesterase family protein n=1 Tax=Nocardia transvalensis TaxID=37333 RepID=UPI00189301DF|nr:thioesterase family protein [Nocardia transvalensis]MBF6328469.1 thioesterase family protein [Nocardia transvalensis]
MTSFAEATAARRIGPGLYGVSVDTDYVLEVSQSAHGGYLLAILLRAALDAVPFPHPVATSAHFLRPGVAGPAQVRVETVRQGRSSATLRAALIQADQTIVEALVTTAALPADAQAAWTVRPPRLPPPDECVPFDPGHRLSPGRRVMEKLDARFDPTTVGWLDGGPPGTPEIRAYFRLREDYPPDACMMALAVDAKPPVALGVGLYGLMVTVELTLHVRGTPAPGWLTLRARGQQISNQWFDEDVELWDSTDTLVAQSRQLIRFKGTAVPLSQSSSP